jgi:hypothetical protein
MTVITWHAMLSRTTHFLASIVALAGFSACSTPYSDVYSFKKNSFKAPPAPKSEITVPPPTSDPFAGQPGTVPATDPSMAIPGLSDPTAAPIPGLEAAPGTPPAPAPATPPAPAPGAPEAAPGTPPPPAPNPSL